MRLANGGLELEGLALPIRGGSLLIQTLRLGLLRVHVRGVRLKTALPNATNSNGLAQLVRRLAARLVQVSVEGPIEVTITAKDGEITAKAINCRIEHQTLRAPAVSISFEGAEASLRELTVSADGASASELTATASRQVSSAPRRSFRAAPPAQQLPWASLALVAGLLAWWPLIGGAGGALGAFSIYGGKARIKKPYELGAARVRRQSGQSISDGHKAAACPVIKCGPTPRRVYYERRTTRSFACGRWTSEPRFEYRMRITESRRSTRAFPERRQHKVHWRLELAVRKTVEAVFVKAD